MANKLKTGLSFLWRWSLLVTVPVASIFLVWAYRTVTKYEDLGVKFETFNDHMSLHRIGSFEAEGVARDLQLAVRPKEFDSGTSLRAMTLYVPEGSENRLNSELPHSGREYVPASLQYPDGSLAEVKLRYRGDHFWHWGARKKSLRVKTKKKALFERIRAMNFSAPKTKDQIVEQLSNELALRFDLIGPRSEMVDLRVNGRNRGVHLLVEQLEEMVIRTNGKMPGDLYGADIVKRSTYTGLATAAFRNPALWEKVAINNHFADDEFGNMERLVEVLQSPPSVERTRALRDLVDIEAFARFGAFRAVCQTFHFDDTHNQRLYYDPWRNHFLPVVWDSVGWHPGALPRQGQLARPDVVTSDLDLALFQDPVYLAARQRAFEDWYRSGKHEAFLERVDELIAQVSPSLDRDPGLCAMLDLLTPEEVRRAQSRIRQAIIKIGRDVRAFHVRAPEVGYVVDDKNPSSLRIRVGSRVVPQGLELAFENQLDGRVEAFISYYSASGETVTADVSAKVELSGTKLRLNVPLAAQLIPHPEERKMAIQRNYTEVKAATYQLTLRGGGIETNRLMRLSTLDSGDQVLPAKRVPLIDAVPFDLVHEAVEPAPILAPQRWSGEMVIEDVRRIAEDVIIAPGTTLRMGPGASVIFEGQLLARGTRAEPIRVVPLNEGQAPWGTLAVRGERANQSTLSYVEMSSGSGLKTVPAEFSAMLSIHDVQDALVADCTFTDSQVVDDMVHAVYSTIRFERCTFVRSLMDALDIDISEAVVSDCEFIESGNDALDLMTSTVVAVGITTKRSGDKGVSVGEDTTALLLRCSLLDGNIGIEMKDRSKATILNTRISGNATGINAYKKNWRYDSGGFGNVYNSIIENNELQIAGDKVSRLQVHDSFVRPLPNLDKKMKRRVHLDKWSDETLRDKARLPRQFQFPGEADDMPSMFLAYWTMARPDLRGPGPVGQ